MSTPPPPPATPPPSSIALPIAIASNLGAAGLIIGIILFGMVGAGMSSYGTPEEGYAIINPFFSLAYCSLGCVNLIGFVIMVVLARRYNRLGPDVKTWLIGAVVTAIPLLIIIALVQRWLTGA